MMHGESADMSPEVAVTTSAAMKHETHARHQLSASPHTLDDMLHLSRYVWAMENVISPDGSVVVDLGCGTGFGLAKLRVHFLRAVGVDLDPAVVDLNNVPGLEDVEFICDNICDAGLADRIHVRNADMVVSMETIEHLEDYFSFLHNVVQIMSPAVVFVVGTPNRSMTYARYPDRRHMDPSHVQELTPISLAHILGEYFQSVELFFQFVPGHWGAADSNRTGTQQTSRVKSAAKGWAPPQVLKLAHRANARLRQTARDTSAGPGWRYSLSDISFAEVSATPELLTDSFALIAVCREPKPTESPEGNDL